MKTKSSKYILIGSFLFFTQLLFAQNVMQNVWDRNAQSLNGQWNAIIDPTSNGDWRKVWKSNKPRNNSEFFEYSFEGGPQLKVPGDFNSQLPELKFYEGTIWYHKKFEFKPVEGQQTFLYFAAVNYMADVYLNEKKIGSHEGGFTPFQFEVSSALVDGENTLVVRVNNQRRADGIPALGYDWLNYGGITRDVLLVSTPHTFIEDYFIQLKKGSFNEVEGWLKLEGVAAQQKVSLAFPEINKIYQLSTNDSGWAKISFQENFQLWTLEHPKLYEVVIVAKTDTIKDRIGFRSIEVAGTNVLLNGRSVFLKAVNIHEENPFEGYRAFSVEDDYILLKQAKELGCNCVRLAHYPHNEDMVKLADEIGLMIWEEIPVYQHIDFKNKSTQQKMMSMLDEMIDRDKNRCAVIIWSVSNETYPSAERDSMNIAMADYCRRIDPARLVSAAINSQSYNNNTMKVWDSIYQVFDIMAINEYLGWYVPWQGVPELVTWDLVCNKPLFISEFGGEAKFASNFGPKNMAAYWSEAYQEKIYTDQISMFKTTPNLCGICPWLLFDYRSTSRLHPVYQNGYNRKGLLSEKGEKKKAWYVLNEFYRNN